MKAKIKVERVAMAAFEGDKLTGGLVVSLDDFAKMRSARLSVTGKVQKENGSEEEVQLLFTRKSVSHGEFRALCEMVGKKGVLEGEIENVRKTDHIRGRSIKYDIPRADLVTTDEKGELAFKFTAAAPPNWAKDFGSIGPEALNFGSTEEIRQSVREQRRRNRQEADLPE